MDELQPLLPRGSSSVNYWHDKIVCFGKITAFFTRTLALFLWCAIVSFAIRENKRFEYHSSKTQGTFHLNIPIFLAYGCSFANVIFTVAAHAFFNRRVYICMAVMSVFTFVLYSLFSALNIFLTTLFDVDDVFNWIFFAYALDFISFVLSIAIWGR